MCTSARYLSQSALALLVFVRSAGMWALALRSPIPEDYTPGLRSA
jgi:hypothetical protein